MLRYMREELLLVIATTSSETVMPQLMAKLENLGCEESVVGLVIFHGLLVSFGRHMPLPGHSDCVSAQATNTPHSASRSNWDCSRCAA